MRALLLLRVLVLEFCDTSLSEVNRAAQRSRTSRSSRCNLVTGVTAELSSVYVAFFRGLHPFRGETGRPEGRFLLTTLRLVGDRVLFDMSHRAQPSRTSSRSFQPVAPDLCCCVPNT